MLPFILSLFSLAVVKIWQKQLKEKRIRGFVVCHHLRGVFRCDKSKQLGDEFMVYFGSHLAAASMTEFRIRAQTGQQLGGRADADPMEQWTYWLALHDLFNLLSYRTQDTSPGMAPLTVSWSSHIKHCSRKWATGLPKGQAGEDIFSTEVLYSQMILTCVPNKTKLANTRIQSTLAGKAW